MSLGPSRGTSTCIYLGIIELLPLWCNEIQDSIKGPRQCDSSDKEDDQDHIGECGGEIHYLNMEKNIGVCVSDIQNKQVPFVVES